MKFLARHLRQLSCALADDEMRRYRLCTDEVPGKRITVRLFASGSLTGIGLALQAVINRALDGAATTSGATVIFCMG